MHPTKNDMATETRSAVCKLLNQRLADLIDLQLQAKQAHWNVKGPHFIGLHKLFDEVSEMVSEHIDEVAERITALGGTAEGTVAAVSKRTEIAPYPLNITGGRDHVDKLSSALAAAGKSVRSGIDQADELKDKDTADLLTAVSRDLDQKLWFVEAHLQGDN